MAIDIEQVKQKYGIVGNDAKLNRAIENAVLSAPTNLSILVTGESGVGKEAFARIIHGYSDRRQHKLVAVNCGAIPEGTIESELFGHKKGSFTGADRDRKGYFTEANGSTIFLDEVGDLPLSVQVKLLRVLQNGEVIPVGESMPQQVDVRVVAATNNNMEEAVREGRFRADLYYRLNQMSIYIPPLRERQNDIPMLFSRFAADIAIESGRPAVMLADDQAREYLMHYPWNGNVRELQNITKRIAWLESERLITREILQKYIPNTSAQIVPLAQGGYAQGHGMSNITDRELLLKALSMGQMISEMRDELYDLRRTVEQLKEHSLMGEPIVTPAPKHTFEPQQKSMMLPSTEEEQQTVFEEVTTLHDDVEQPTVIEADLPLDLNEREKMAIKKALELHKGNRKMAAKDLGISERTLYRRIKDLGL